MQTTFTIKELFDAFPEVPNRWGVWELRSNMTLRNTENGYEIDLEKFDGPNDFIFWILKLADKNPEVYGTTVLTDFVDCIHDLLRAAKIRDVREAGTFTGKQLFKAYRKKHKAKRTVPLGLRHMVFARDSFRCCDCGASASTGAILQIDHTIPVSKGGETTLNNLRTLCQECNLGKSDKIVEY
jgi:hypothetical protein